jgi:DNA-binding LytR/AlgR family response regulator
MLIPVLQNKDNGSTELVLLDLNDVIYICVENRHLVYHTLDSRYEHISTLSDLEEHLYRFGFELTDKTNLVNFKKIKKLDSKQGKLYFEEHPTEDSKYATIAFIKQKIYKQEIQRAIANNTNTSLEFTIVDGKRTTITGEPNNSKA